jgi:hypothetical protein
MSTERFGEVDLDRLAEYADGLLDPARAAEVERLVATEPAWARTLDALTAAQPRVHDALAELAFPPVPDDVVERLSAAISAAAPDAVVIDLAERRRRWSRVAVGAAAAVAAVAVGLGGFGLLHGVSNSSKSSSAPVAGSAQYGAAGAAGNPTVEHSGTDYTAQTLTSVLGLSDAAAGQGTEKAPPLRSLPNAGDFARLDAPAGLQACLQALAVSHQKTATLVDYARFRGQPALVVVLSGTGAREVVVVGSRCGLPGSGADEIYVLPVR